jgi:phosphate starvation-inducible PhoH-like protein
MFEATIPAVDSEGLRILFGPRDQHVHAIRDALGVAVVHRNGEILITGEEDAVARATTLLEQLKATAQRSGQLEADEVTRALELLSGRASAGDAFIEVFQAARRIKPRTPGQQTYVDAIRGHDLTFGIGPAGSGKTYLAVALAVEALKQKRVRKIVLVRPAVEAGESLGFLPGDLKEKIGPYLRPLLDALQEMLDPELIKRYTEQEIIEVIPLAYMRGRTLNEAFIILDEAQNATIAQMKMFLTRLGAKSKIVVSGDITQVDLPRSMESGLIDAARRLVAIEGVSVVRLSKADIVRHRLVAEIVRAYDDHAETPPPGRRS